MITTYKRLGELLVARGSISNLQLSIALADQRISNRRLGEIFVERGFATEIEIATCLAEQYSYPIIDLTNAVVENETICKLAAEDALQLRALPICETAAGVVVAIADPIDVVATDRLQALMKCKLLLHVAPENSLMRRIRTAYGLNEEFSPTAFAEAEKAPKRFRALASKMRFGPLCFFDATDMALDRKVSLTCIPLGDPRHTDVLEVVRAASKGDAPALSAVHDTVSYGEMRWTVLSRVQGECLERILRVRGARSVTASAELVATVAENLDELQRCGGPGHWVCPSNIFMGSNGPLLAPIVPAPEHYLCPSGFDPETPGSATAYALGALLKDCLLGTNGQGSNVVLPAPMNDILANCLAWEPKSRFGSAIEVASALRAFNWAALSSNLGRNTDSEKQSLLQTLELQETDTNTVSIWDRLFRRKSA